MKKIILFTLILILMLSCANETSGESSKSVNYLKEIPSSAIDKILKSRLASAVKISGELKGIVNDFSTDIGIVNLEKLQSKYKKLTLIYAKLYIFNVGKPKKEHFYNRRINFWPVYNLAIDKSIIENKVTEENFKNFGSASRNLPGIQYLLFKYDDNQKIIEEYKTQPLRIKYLKLAVNDLEIVFKAVNNMWFGDTNYADTFKSNTEQGLEGAFNMLYNGMYNVIDNCKVTKIGKPAGLEKSHHTNAETLEAYYSKQSIDLIMSNLESVEELFFSEKITNIASYLDYISKNNEVSEKVKERINICKKKLKSIQNPLTLAVDQEKVKVKELHQAYKNLLVVMDTDVRSTLSLIITGTDNDGD